MYKHILGTFVFIALAMIVVAGCNSSRGEVGEQGAWLGEGTFHAPAGTEQIKAQLEILSDNSYRFVVLEPRMLMLVMGVEEGTWSRADQQLNLTPYEDQTSRDGSLLAQTPKNFRPKSLAIEGANAAFILKDEQMDLRFEPNPKATEKLRESGEVK